MSRSEERYLFDQSRDEDGRLRDQGTLLDPITRRMLVTAGLTPGSRVLDVGSGAGNVSLLAADLVGDEGFVVGLDRDPGTVRRAQDFVTRSGRRNIEFRLADLTDLDHMESDFDAVVGRLVLMYLRDPTAALRGIAERVRTGGLICLQEADMSYSWAVPETPLWEQSRDWFQQVMMKAGVRTRMGHELFAAFRSAGLPAPSMNMESRVISGAEARAYSWANVVIGALPLMEEFGVTTAAEMRPESLADRMQQELTAHDGIMISGPLFGAWVTKP